MGCLSIPKNNKGNQKNAIDPLVLRKRGKREGQCKCIDYLYASTQTPEQAPKKGCLASLQKKAGCLGNEQKAWTMDDYINYVDETINSLNLREKAISKIGLDETQISEIPPVVLNSFIYRGDDIAIKSEETSIGGIWRNVSNKYSVTWIFFSATQIYTYTYILDTTSDNAVEYTKDFFYTDITCIRTEHEVEENIIERKKTLQGCGCFKKNKEPESQYYHANKEYDTLSITVPNDSYSFCCLTNETIEQSIQAAKAMIREKKNG